MRPKMVGFRVLLIACAALVMLLNSGASAQSNGTMDDPPQVEDTTQTGEIEGDGVGRIEATRDLDAFTAIRSCLPFNVLVSPGPDDATYSLIVNAEKEVVDAVVADVDEGVLALSTTGGFNTTLAIKVTVVMPKDTLDVLEKTSAADMVVAPGFEVRNMSLISGTSGVGRFIVTGLTADQMTIENSGTSEVFVEGQIRSARVSASGTGTVYVTGVTEVIDVDGSQIAKIVLNPASADVKIGGISSGLARIRKTKGSCDVVRGRVLFPACTDVDESEFPDLQQVFSCGLIVDGMISCDSGSDGQSEVITAAGNSATATASTTGGGTSSASASATGSGDSVTAQASASSGGSFALVTPEGAADAVAVAPQICEETSDALLMFQA